MECILLFYNVCIFIIMKYILILLILLLTSCVSYNNYCTEKWIKDNPKPIIVK